MFENKVMTIENQMSLLNSWVGSIHQACATNVPNVMSTHSLSERRLTGWQPPEPLNMDGAFKASVGKSAAGGTLRDNHGVWKGGFSLKLGKCTTYRAELWNVYKGLLLAWDLGYRKIDLQIDNKMVVEALKNPTSHPYSNQFNLFLGINGRFTACF